MTEPALILGTFGLQAFGDFAFLLPLNLYVLAPSRLNAYNTPLPSLVDRPFRATNNVPLFYVEEEPYFGLVHVCFTNIENRARHIRSTDTYLRIHPWLDCYMVVVPRMASESGEEAQGPQTSHTAISVGFAFGIRTSRHPVHVLQAQELVFAPANFVESEAHILHSITHLEAPAPPKLHLVPRFPATLEELIARGQGGGEVGLGASTSGEVSPYAADGCLRGLVNHHVGHPAWPQWHHVGSV
ncbi:hypothetical protein FISHEDRAFT_74454 [Fistulina hepatica ATCC 64428]|uniref:Uncharacterized protein n=1 Tax=Fistulina hepatica ATCC 64428 TaxID=1128425 RepID=A0A0D7A9G3_9AGAR|nr:hypothetical protein FISHEDRAFT_74454 [Fistulina hepatica ATCC 64428]